MSDETADLQMFNRALEKALVAECDSQRARIERLEALLRRYRTETPLGHQPHMIAAEVDAALAGDMSCPDPDDYVSVPDKIVRRLACVEESEMAAMRAEIERLKAERDEWKANYEEAYRGFAATIKEFKP